MKDAKREIHLDTQLGSSPVSSLGVVSDGVVSLQSDPLRQWSVLLGGLSQLLLDLETLVSLCLLVWWSNQLFIMYKSGR